MEIKKIKKTLDIGEVVELTGLPPSTLRFYEEKGLIRSAGRNGLRRFFDRRILEQLEFIAMGQQAGFALEEIAAMFSADGRLQVDRKLLLLKAIEMERNIKQLEAIRKTIQHVANCSAPDHMECPKFKRLLHLAGKHQTKVRNEPKLKASSLKSNARPK